MSVTPNPSAGLSQLTLPEAHGTLVIMDGMGRTVSELAVTQMRMDLPLLVSGNYYVIWTGGNTAQKALHWVVLP